MNMIDNPGKKHIEAAVRAVLRSEPCLGSEFRIDHLDVDPDGTLMLDDDVGESAPGGQFP